MSEASGKFIIRVDPDLHKKLRAASERKGISLNQFCAAQLSAAVADSQERREGGMFGIPLAELRDLAQSAGLPVIAGVLFGSVSRGEATSSSDIDLLLVLPGGVEPDREWYRVWDRKIAPALRPLSANEISPQFAAIPRSWSEAGSLWFEVALEGIILWETTREVSAFLIQIREAIAEGKISRRVSHGHPFWVRNE